MRSRQALLYLLCAILATIVTSAAAVAADRALIIGIDRYPHLPARLQLTAAVNDARLMDRIAREVWYFSSENIKVLLNEEATSRSILASIERWLIEGTQTGDRVLLTYAGHGYFRSSTEHSEPTGNDQTLAPADVVRVGSTYANMISDDDIGKLLARLEGRQVMVVMDSCHSGTIARALNAKPREGTSIVRSLADAGTTRSLAGSTFERVRRARTFAADHSHVMAWTAVASTELAEEDMSLPEAGRHGVFTRRFADGLLGRRADLNKNGIISPFELIHYVRRRASEYCDGYLCRTRMTPTLEWPSAFATGDLLAWGAGSSTKPAQKPETVTQKSEPSVAVHDILVQENTDGVVLEILPGPTLKLGGELKIRISSPRAGYLVVLDVRDDGKVVQLFPSKCARTERRLRPRTHALIPDATYGCVFAASETGKGRIVALVTADNVPLDALVNRHRDLEIVPTGIDHIADIARQLLKVWTGDPRNRSARWALAVAPYEVHE